MIQFLSRKIIVLGLFFAAGVWLFFVGFRADAASISSGNLIKGMTNASVYYYGADGKRYVFPNEKTFFTWYTDFSSVKTISDTELATLPIGGNVTYRPGVKLVKIMTDPKVYAVAEGGVLRWATSEALAISLYGTDWNKKVDDIPDTFFVNYTVGASIISSSGYTPANETLAASTINVDKGFLTLKALAEQRNIRIGALYQYDLRNGDARSDLYDRTFETEMNALTIGTFWGDHPSRTQFNFTSTDATVNWGRAHGQELYAQTLIWYAAGDGIPDWLKATPNAEVEAVMNEYIDTMVGRYKGRIKFWNVVNEAVNDGDSGTLRQDHKWAEAMGDDYIRKAFVRAHAADPTAVLYYNDYDIESNRAKYDGVKALLIKLKNQGAPVHALGWQLHVKPSSFVASTLLARMNEIADLGFDNYITELDVELPVNASEADYEQQKQTYRTIVQTFLAARRHKTIIVWGLRDGDPYWLTNNHPLLFDENYRKKPAYVGVQEALK